MEDACATDVGGAACKAVVADYCLGRAVQVDPMKPKLKPPGTNRLKLKCDILLSTSAFKVNLRRYTWASARCRTRSARCLGTRQNWYRAHRWSRCRARGRRRTAAAR